MSPHDAERDGYSADLDGFDHILDPDFIGKLANELYASDGVMSPIPTPASASTSVPESVPYTANAAGGHDHWAEAGYPHLPADLASLAGGDKETASAAIAPEVGQVQPDYRGYLAGIDTPSMAQRFGLRRYYFLPEPLPSTASPTPAQSFDVQTVRRDFPALHQTVNGKQLIWLDNAATSQKPQCVIDALERYYQRDNSNVHRGAHTLAARATEAYEGARQKVQRFLGAGSEREIVFVRGTTEAINLVAQTYGRKYVRAGDEIVLTTLEHHSNIVPWQMLAQETGAVIRVVPISDAGEVMLDEYQRLLGPRTKLVAMSHVSNVLGTVLPVQAMTRAAHRYGARVLVDGAQAVPHTRVNVQELGSDFYAFSGHKLFGPTGIGALYGREELLEAVPPWQGGGSMIKSVSFEESTYADIPAKFEAGTPNIADAVGLGTAIDYLERIGFDAAVRYEEELTAYGMQALTGIPGLRQIGTVPHKLSVLSFVLDGIQTEDVGRFLDREGIAVRAGHHCAQPTMRRYGVTSTVRPALAFYNTLEEIDALTVGVRKAQRELSAR